MFKSKTSKPSAKSKIPAQVVPEGWLRFLRALPVQNVAVQTGCENEDLLLPVTVKVERPRWLVPPLSWVFPVSRSRTVKLDPIGRSVWAACDGKVRVEQIVDDFAKRQVLSFHEARIAVTQYLEVLVQRGLVVLVFDQEATHS